MGNVGEAVRERRRFLGINQTELGKRAGGLSQDYISKLENGIIETPQRGTMDALATALGVPVAVLYRAAGILEGVDESASAATTEYEPNVERFRNLATRPRIVAQLRKFRAIDDSLFDAAEVLLEQLLAQRARGAEEDRPG